MGEGGSGGIGRGGQSARRGGMALFEAAPSEGGDSRKAGKSSIYGNAAFSDVEKENEVCNRQADPIWPCRELSPVTGSASRSSNT